MVSEDGARAIEQPAWPMRTFILLMVGAIGAFAIQQFAAPEPWRAGPLPGWRVALATAAGVAGLSFGFGLSRIRVPWTVAFAVLMGLVAGGIVWWNGEPQGVWSYSGGSLFLAVAIAVPLFQVARDEGRAVFPYAQIHGYAWTNVVLWFACWAFAGISLLLSHLVGELFALIGIDAIKRILGHNWSNSIILGAAFGAALGMLRDRDRVVRLLENLVTTVLGVFAPVLAAALLLFVLSLPFTGLNRLWGATRETTPILMGCVFGGLILVNAVIGHGPEDEAANPVLRWSAIILGIVILPLAIVAVIAMNLRLAQHGMTPDRLWGLTCAAFAVAYGLVYLLAVVRKRAAWVPVIRRDNIRLAFATMAAAVLLATPLLGFNRLSAADQVARLTSGKVSVDAFDWAALGYDFGDAGKAALKRLATSPNGEIRIRADAVLKAGSRYQAEIANDAETQRFKGRLDVEPAGIPLPDTLRKKIVGVDAGLDFALDDGAPCKGSALCRIYMQPGGTAAIVIGDGCMTLAPVDRVDPARKCAIYPAVFFLRGKEWVNSNDLGDAPSRATSLDQQRTALTRERADIDAGKVEIRDITQQQLFIGDKPVGQPFERP